MALRTKRDAYLAHNLALREYYRRDFPTYAREQLWIETKVAGKIENLDISKKPLQTMFWRRAYEQIKTVGYIDGDIIKGRQQGSSTCSQGTIFWKASLTRNYNTLLIAQDDPTTRAIFEKARFFYEHLAQWLKPAIRKCVDAKTECLSEDGWKRHDSLKVGERIYAIDPQTGEGCWAAVESIFRDEGFEGDLVRWDSDDIDAFITPEHRWLTTTFPRKDREPGISRRGSGGHAERVARYSIAKTSEIKCGDIIPKAAPCGNADAPYSDELLSILAWLVTEGHFNRFRNQVSISQSKRANPLHVKTIAALLDTEKIDYTTSLNRAGVQEFRIYRNDARWLRGLLPDKRFDWGMIRQFSSRQAALVLKHLVDGDGSMQGNRRRYWSADPVLLDQVQAIATIAGVSSHLFANGISQRLNRRRAIMRYGDVRLLNLHKIPYAWCGPILRSQTIERYRGTIWCPQTTTGTWLARRNGTVYFTHNSNRQELVFAVAEGKKHVTDHGLGSTMSFQAATNMLAGTGTTRQGLHLSECAKYRGEDIDTLVSSVYPVLYRGPGSIRLKESTAFIGGGWFKEVCEEARDGRTQEFLLFVPAYLEPDNRYPLNPKDPDDQALARMVGLDAEEKYIVRTAKRGYDSKDPNGKAYEIPPFEVPPEYIKFRRVTIAQPGWDEDLYHQEYPTTFNEAWISRDSRVFNHQKLYEMQKAHVQQPKRLMVWDYQTRKFEDHHAVRMGPQENYIAIWEEPILGHDYDMGADVAAGIEGGDYSAAVVWERRSRRQVAEVHLHIDPSDYGTLLFFLGQWYFNAQIAVEWTGGYGISTDTQLKRLNYPNISFWKHRDQVVPMPTKKTGWETTQTSKAYLVSYFRHFLNHDNVIIRSLCLLNEMFHFIQIPYGNGYEYRAETGNDDLVMGGGIGLVISDDENIHRADEVAPEPKSIVVAPQHLVDNFDFTDRLPNSLIAEIRGGY